MARLALFGTTILQYTLHTSAIALLLGPLPWFPPQPLLPDRLRQTLTQSFSLLALFVLVLDFIPLFNSVFIRLLSPLFIPYQLPIHRSSAHIRISWLSFYARIQIPILPVHLSFPFFTSEITQLSALSLRSDLTSVPASALSPPAFAIYL